jgi:hypothetical protein
MAGEIAYKLTAEEKQAIDAIRKVAEAYANVEGGVKKVSEESRKAQKEQEEFGRLAKRVWEDTRTPMEAHQSRMERLAKMVQQGKLDADTYSRAASDSYAKMEKALTKTGDEAKKTGDELKRTGDKGSEAFSGLGKQILSAFSTLTGFAGTLGTINQVLDKMREAKREAAQEARDAEFDVGSLKQMTGGDQKRYDTLAGAAKEIFSRGGARSMAEGARIAFALESAGILDQRETFIQLKAKSIINDTAGLARSTKTMITSMGEDQAGTVRQVISKGMAAGRWAPTYMQEILPAAARAGTEAKTAGITDKELLATTALLAEAGGDPGRATTQEKAMFRTITLAKAYGERKEAPIYSEEEYDRDKEQLDRDRDALMQQARHAAKRDPQYVAQMHKLDVEEARIGTVRKGAASNPEEVARRKQRQREIAEERAKATEDAEIRVKQSNDFTEASDNLDHRKNQMIARRKAASAGLVTDEDGQIVDDERQKLLAAAGRTMKGADGDMMSQLKALRGMKLDAAQMTKLFGRREGYNAMELVLNNEWKWSQSLADITKAEKEDEIKKDLALKDPRPQAAARAARVEGVAERESAEEIGVGANIYEAAEKRNYRLIREGKAETFLPAEVSIALHKVAVETVGKLPGQKKRSLRAMYEAGAFEPEFDVSGDSGLKGEVEQELGIRDKKTGQLSEHMDADAATSFTKLNELLQSTIQAHKEAAQAQKEAGEKLGKIADKMDSAGESPRSTLSPKNRDPGDRH